MQFAHIVTRPRQWRGRDSRPALNRRGCRRSADADSVAAARTAAICLCTSALLPCLGGPDVSRRPRTDIRTRRRNCCGLDRSRVRIRNATHPARVLRPRCMTRGRTDASSALAWIDVVGAQYRRPHVTTELLYTDRLWVKRALRRTRWTIVVTKLRNSLRCRPPAEAAWVDDTIRYDTRCYFNVHSKADIS